VTYLLKVESVTYLLRCRTNDITAERQNL